MGIPRRVPHSFFLRSSSKVEQLAINQKGASASLVSAVDIGDFMEPGVFYRKLRQLNPNLKIWCGNDDTKPAGLYYVKQDEYTEICGVDKQEVPEHTVLGDKNKIVKSGWRRTLRVLIKAKLIDQNKAEKVFNCSLDTSRRKVRIRPSKTPGNALQSIQGRVLNQGM